MSFTEADLIRTLRTGERPRGAGALNEAMLWHFGRMSDGALRSIYLFLTTLPPKRPASCKRGPHLAEGRFSPHRSVSRALTPSALSAADAPPSPRLDCVRHGLGRALRTPVAPSSSAAPRSPTCRRASRSPNARAFAPRPARSAVGR